MNILFILPQIPYPPHSGGRIVTWNTLKRFAAQCDVSVVCLYHDPSELEYLEEVKKICCEVTAFPANGKWSLKPLLKSMCSTAPYKAHRFWNREMAQYIQQLLQRQRFDVIHAQNFYTAAYINGSEPCFKVHYKENVEGNILLRYSEHSPNLLVKLAARLEGWRTKRYEINLCRRFDQILTISPDDREVLLHHDNTLPVSHQRPGVDLDAYPFLDEPDDPPSILFTGTMSYYPNVTGMLTFLRGSWPSIRAALPKIECWIVGANPPQEILDYDGRNGIHVTGRVPSIDQYMKQTTIYIVPLTVGGGIRLKILEAMASGRAIVSTPVGCEGLDGLHNQHLLIADLPKDFADAVIQLATDADKRNHLRHNAYELVRMVYDWDKVIPNQVELYRSRFHHPPQ